MSKNSNAAGGTKERILRTAERIFTENGYEDTSVRMILDESDSVAGSFYHFFGSKQALFEAVVERYLAGYTEQVARIAADADASAVSKLDALLSLVSKGAKTYFGALHAEKLHWTVQYALHEKTMQAIMPSIELIVKKALDSCEIESRLHTDERTLTAVLLKGVEAILHAHPMESIDERGLVALRNTVTEFIGLVVAIKPRG